MQVWHPPGPAVLVPPAGRVYKGEVVVLQCEVEEGGRGGAAGHRVQWSREGELVQGVTSSNWTLSGIPTIPASRQVARILGLIDYSPKMWVSCPEETTPAKVTLSGPILFLWVDSGYNLKFDIGRGE